MKRRSRAGREPVKTRRRKTITPKHRDMPKVVRRNRASVTGQEANVARLARELHDALQQQAATAELLKAISGSTFDLQTVLNTLTELAARLCEAEIANIWRPTGSAYRLAAGYGVASRHKEALENREYLETISIEPGRGSIGARTLLTGKTVHVLDVQADPEYALTGVIALGGYRTTLGVPLLRDEDPIGVLVLARTRVEAFTQRQIDLVTTFAAQAVIAIENTRLLNELRQSLEQQTATADVLKVISRSTFDLKTVLQTLVESAVRLCDADKAVITRERNGAFYRAETYGFSREFMDFVRDIPIEAERGSASGRALLEGRAVHIADVKADPEYTWVEAQRLGDFRTIIGVPMLREGVPIGVLTLTRSEVRPFSDKQIELVSTFADQAAIAIENVRLFEAEQQRTRELSESLEQQTAAADVLRIISSSPGELEPVFQAMLANATKLCGASYGAMWLSERGGLRAAAMHGALPDAYLEQWRARTVYRPSVESPAIRAITTRQPVQIDDLREDQAYLGGDPLPVSAVERGGVRTLLAIPMFKDDEAVGVIAIYRREVRPFTDKQIALVQNFAAQAVIAIENTRLLNELRQSLQQQTATADVLKVISRSTFNLQTVLDTLVESAALLCEADMSGMVRLKGTVYEHAANYGLAPELHEYMRNFRLERGRATVAGRVALEGKVVQVVDIEADSDYVLVDAMRRAGTRTILGAPLLREGVPIGVIILMRKTVRPFTDKQIDLVTTFADQAVIAIENVRLFDEIQDKSRQLEEASQHKSQFLANMSHELRTPLNAILGYTELMADGAYGEPSEKMLGVLKRLESNGRHLLGLINDVLDLSKIEAGQLVLDLADYSLQSVTQTVYSAVEPLATDKKLTFQVEVAPNLPPGRGDERRLTQVLLNLVGNAIKFTDAGEVAIKATVADGSFKVAVHDTGPGISPADQAKLFQEFQQADNTITRKKGGTGLGLAISKRIIEMHGGRIWIDSVVGQGSTFSFTVPVRVERQVETT
jgi:signal transduction histidine kinase